MKFERNKKTIYLKKLKDFLNKYGKFYEEDILEFIKDEFYHLQDIDEVPDVLMELYAEFGMLKDYENFYLGFSNMIGEKYGYDANILEVAGGCYPVFAKYMRQKQIYHNGKGTVTVYDPRLVTTKINNLKLYKKEFTLDTDIKNYDLLVGVLPCEATRLIIEKAILGNKEFFIGMCGCTHFELKELYWSPFGMIPRSYDEWVDTVYDTALICQNRGYDVTKKYVKEFYFEYPIISSKKIR